MGNSGPPAAPGKLLALDVGMSRIGVAVCDPLWLGVRPVTVVQRRSRNEDFAVLANLAAKQEVQAVICGLPLKHVPAGVTLGESWRCKQRSRWLMEAVHSPC